MFDDRRSKRVILVAHCVLNQNAKLDRCAHYPGVMREVAGALAESGVGIIQMPCPELLHLGLDRGAPQGAASTVAGEDTRIGRLMAAEKGRAACRAISRGLAGQVEEYRKNGFEVVGVLGIDGSPSCGVGSTWSEGREAEGPGALVRELAGELAGRGISIGMQGVKALEPEKAVGILTELLRPGKSGEGG